MSLTATTVLGKRKNRVASENLLLQLSASESNHEQSDVSWQDFGSEAESPQTPRNSNKKSEYILVNGSLVKNAKRKYHCTFSSCDKSYSKPCRLEEHERSHTGEVGLSFVTKFRARSMALNRVDHSDRLCAPPATNLICARLISKLTSALICPIPIAHLSAQKWVARRGFGQRSI